MKRRVDFIKRDLKRRQKKTSFRVRSSSAATKIKIRENYLLKRFAYMSRKKVTRIKRRQKTQTNFCLHVKIVILDSWHYLKKIMAKLRPSRNVRKFVHTPLSQSRIVNCIECAFSKSNLCKCEKNLISDGSQAVKRVTHKVS